LNAAVCRTVSRPILLRQGVRRQEQRGHAVEGAVFGRLVQQRVADVGLGAEHFGGQQMGRDLVQVPVARGQVEHRVAGIAALAHGFEGEQIGRNLIEVAADGGVMQGV